MTVKRLADAVGLDGKFTNHSLRATSATRMYTTGIPEKLIKEVTSHRSDCVHEYECTPDSLKRTVSATLASNPEPAVKHQKHESAPELTGASTIEQCLDAANIGNIVNQMGGNKVNKVSVRINFEMKE